MEKFEGAFEDKSRTYHITFNENKSFLLTGIHVPPSKDFPNPLIAGFYTLYVDDNGYGIFGVRFATDLNLIGRFPIHIISQSEFVLNYKANTEQSGVIEIHFYKL